MIIETLDYLFISLRFLPYIFSEVYLEFLLQIFFHNGIFSKKLHCAH